MFSGARRARFRAALAATVLGIALVASIVFSFALDAVNNMVFRANSESLEETYSEVSQNFTQVSHSRWNYLDQLAQYLELASENNVGSAEVLERLQSVDYGCTDFYFVSESGAYMMLGGEHGNIDLGSALFTLMDKGEDIVVDGSLPGRDAMVFYAVPTNENTFEGFTYRAIAFGYNNEDISQMFTIDSYEGTSEAYIVYNNGRMAFSMGNTSFSFTNLYTLLGDAKLSDITVADVQESFKAGETATFLATFNGVDYYVSHQAIAMENANLVSFTPASVVNRQMTNISNTMAAVIASFVGAAALLIVLGLSISFRRFMKRRSEREAEKEIAFALISNDMDAVYILLRAIDFSVIYVSPSIERLLGVDVDAVYESPHALKPCTVDSSHTIWTNEQLMALGPGKSKREECEIKNARTGEIAPYTLSILHPEGLEASVYMVALSDRSEEERVRKNVQDALEVARAANESKSNFLASMSHDIRTPMNAILGFVQLARREADKPDKVRGYVDKIETSGHHLLNLINEVLDMSKIEAGKTTLTFSEIAMDDFVGQLTDIIEPQAAAKGLNFEVDCQLADPPVTVLADQTHLMQVLLNVLSNAVKYTPKGGTVRLTAKRLRRPSKVIAYYRFTVADTGVGMTPEFLKTIWDPFSREETAATRGIQGTGLGLAITRNLVELMGGSISVESELGRGSTFEVVVSFKIVEQAALVASGDEVALAEAASLDGLRILAAEDNELNAELLADLMEMEGARLSIVGDGKRAVETFEACVPGSYDLILMDVQMPVMNGYDATRAIRASAHPEAQTIPIIAMTANTFTEDVQRSLDAGMNAHLAKPLNMDEVKRVVTSVLNGRGGDF